MRTLAFVSTVVLLAASCGSGGGGSAGPAPRPGQGAITIAIVPNPIMAQRVSGDTYDFPFEVVIRETGGRVVEIARVSAEVYALGSIRLANESYDAARIRSLGYSTTVPAGGELRYRFVPRQDVADDRLFGGVTARLRVEGTDDAGNRVVATTEVTVRR